MCDSFQALSPLEAAAYSPLALAFLGDSVFERLVRQKILIAANRPVADLHNLAVSLDCCQAQARAISLIAPLLSEEEERIYKRGRNATGNSVPRHANPVDYRKATGLEALFGYLQLCNRQERMLELFECIWNDSDTNL